jgi:hypothetical protein
MPKFTLEIVECPECTAPAEIVDRFVLDSTDGPIEHAIVLCVLRHRFTVLVERLVSPPAALPEQGRADHGDSRGPRPGRTAPKGTSAP